MLFRMCRTLNVLTRLSMLSKSKYIKPIIMSRTVSSATNKETFNTIQELSEKLAKTMGVEVGYKPIPSNRNHLIQYLPKSQKDLPPRSMKDSFLVALIPLSTDLELQDKYITFLGHVRLGRLLEDMDIFAVMIAQKHILIPNLPKGVASPYTLVTALVDRIDFSEYIPKPQEDIKISGHVSWVGRSSLEVVVWLEQQSYGTWHRITRALFLIAARDPTNKTSAVVNPLVPADDREREIFSGGEQRKRNRIAIQKLHVSKVIPNDSELRIIHDLYLRTTNDNNVKNIKLPSGCEWMENCSMSNIIFSQPENRNLHNTVFGGFIMRQALELTWALGFRFSKYRPKLKSISDINFNKPIAVNSLIQMYAVVVFTHMQYMQITVYVETFDPNTGRVDTTNTLHCTYEVPDVTLEVIPKTYHETMMYIDGRRHFFEIMNSGNDSSPDLTDEGIVNKSKL